MKKLLTLLTLCCFAITATNAQILPKKVATHKVTTNKKHHHKKKHKSTAGMRTQHNIKVADDDRAAYEGKNSKANDGVKKNKQRNLNYQNNGANLAPSTGNNTK